MNLFKSLSKSIFLLCFFCAFLVFESCDVGLGESVDTIPPTISITYPPTSSVIRDAFVVSGTWVDDKGVSLVKLTLKNEETGETVASRFAGIGIGTWNTSFNVASKDESGKLIYPIPDGKYTISVTAMDLSGRISATSYRSIEIDNTAPVFVISKPGVLVDNNSSSALKASPFGSIFRIVGSIAEAHSVKSMEVKVFAKNGEGEPIASWKEEDINISGGTSVTFARFTNSKDKNDYLHKRYIDIYGDGTTGSKEFSCSVTLTDSAGVYQSDSYSDSNTLNYNGNKTSVVWLNDDINAGKDYDLLSKNANPQFEIGDLMKILNGTYNSSLTGKDSEAALNVLKNTIKNTEEEKLAFSINKDANPTYSILGYGFDDTNYDEPNHFYKIISKAAQKGMLALRAQYGQDGTYFFPKELKVYVFGPYIPKEITDMEYNALSADERDKYLTRQKLAEIYDSVDNYYDTHKDNKDGECAWLIWDGSKEALDEGSTSNYSVSVQLPEDIKANNYYVIAVTGVDKDGLNFIPENSGFYGLIGASNGVPPVISLDSIEQGAYHKDINFLSKISGNIKSTETVIESVTYRVKILDILNKNNLVGVISGSALADDGKEFLNAQDINYYFGITEEQLKEKNVEISEGKMYAFEISVDGLDNTGGAASKTITAYLDTKKPEIKISSVSPIAKEKVVNEQTKQIINGIVKVIANVTEEYLENVNITVKDGNGKTYSPSVNSGSYIAFDFNTTEFKSASQEDAITIEISAVDKAGNYNTLVDNSYVINQSSDTPLLETDTKEQSECNFDQIAVNNNLFGIKSNNKLTATITDDDGIGAITAVIYNKEDETVKDNKQIFSPAGKKTYNLTLNLPKEEGKYVVSIEAKDIYYDKNEDGKVTTDAQKSLRSFKKYYNVAVDAGNPVFNITTVNNAMTAANTAKTVEGTASDFSGLKSLVRYAVNKNDDSAEKTAAETWWFADPAKNDGKENTITFKDSTFKDTISADYIGGTDGRRRYIATDIYGNESIIDFVYFVDNKAPEITKITNPKDGEEIYNGNNIFALKGNAKDNKDLDKIRFCVLKDTEPEPETVASPIDAGEKNYKDASGWQSGTFATSNNSDGTTDFTCNIDLRDKDLGKYNVFIAIFDKANNQSYVSSNSKILLTSDKDAPEIQTVEVSKPGYNLEDYNALTEIEISVKASDDVGLKAITVLKGSSELITKDVNEKTFDGTVILPVSKEAGKETLVDGTNTFSVVSTDFAGNSSETKTFTITLDSTPPDVSISSVTPIAAEEDGLNIINGVITIKGSVIESNLNSAYLEISDTSEPKNKKVISLDTGKSIFTEMVDTTQFNDGGITIKLSATDVAGNYKELSEISYEVRQSTDSPSIETETKDSDSCALEDIAANNNLFGTKSNNKFTATITDDDGIAEVTAVIYNSDGTVKDDTQTFNPDGKKTYTLTLTLPSDEAKYVVKINAKDIYYDFDDDGKATDDIKKARRSFEKVYNVAVDAGNPAFNITTVNNAMTAANTAKTVTGTASDSSGLKSLVRYAIDSGDVTGAAETWWYKDKAPAENTITFEGSTFTDTISADGIGGTDGRRRYIATDIYGNESIIDFVYSVDNEAPVITEITNPAGGSAIYNGNNIFALKGKAKDNKDLDTIRFCVLKDTDSEPETVASPIDAGKNIYKDASGWQPGTFATSKNGDGTTDFTCNIDLHDNDPGEYKVFIALFDKANNQSYVSSNSKIVLTSDKNAPVTQTVAVSKTGYNLEDYNALSEIEISVKASDDVGLKSITVSKGGSELIKKDITGNEYDGTVTLGKETLIDGTNTFSVVSTDLAGNSSETKIFTITLDSTPPDVSISSVTPIAEEEGNSNIINGVITIKGSVIESNLNSAYLEISDTSEPKKTKKIELNTGKSIFTEMVDTTQFNDGGITIKLSATDVAGNYKELSEISYEVRQSTDSPSIETETKDSDSCALEDIAANNNLFGTKSNNKFTATITDDDGIAEVTAVIYKEDGTTVKDETQTFSPAGKKTYNLTLTLPSEEAKYVVKINAKDIYYNSDADGTATDSTKKARRSFEKVYNVGVDAGDPVLSLKTTNNAMIAGNKEKTVEGIASDSGGLISLVRYAIGSGDVTGAAEAWWFADPAKNDDKANTITFEGTTFTDTISADGAAGIGDTDGRRRYIATDIYGNTSTLDFSYLVDSLAPVIKVDPSVAFANGEWRASKTQKVQVLVTDTDEGGTKHSSGITNVKYVIDPVSANQETIKEGTDLAIGASRDSDGTTSGNKVYNIYSTTFDFADDGIHSIYAGTWDSVGNYKQIGPITYKIDTTLPKILELLGGTGEAKASVAAPISMNANSHEDFNVYVTSDDKNGESSDVSGIKKIIIRKGSKDVETDELDSAAVAVDSRKITIPADKITEGTNTFTVYSVDAVGNESIASSPVIINYDGTAPEVKFTSHKAEDSIYKTITLKGSVHEANGLSSEDADKPVLQYKRHSASEWTDAVAGTDYTSISVADGIWTVTGFDTTKLDNTDTPKTYDLRLVFTDIYGNKNADAGITVSVDQNADRPVISLTTISEQNEVVSSRTIYGNVTDSDGTVQNLWVIENSEFDSVKSFADGLPKEFDPEKTEEENKNCWIKAKLNNSGSWSVNFNSIADSAHNLYFCVQDKKGDIFYTTETDTTAAKLARPRIALSGVEISNAVDNNAPLSFSIDTVPPKITMYVSNEALAADAVDGNGNTLWAAAGLILGGTKNQLHIKLEVIENNIVRTGAGTAESPYVYRLPSLEIAGRTISSVALRDSTSVTGAGTAESPFVFLLAPITLEKETYSSYEGSKSVMATLPDISGQEGQGGTNIILDYTAPTVQIISPTAQISDAVSAAVTVKGIVTDNYSAIERLEYVIPRKDDVYNTTSANWAQVYNSGASWEIEFSSGSVESTESLCYYGKNYANYTGASEVTSGLGVYKVPMWFRATDSVGNIGTITVLDPNDAEKAPELFVYVDPDGGKPKAWINSPESGTVTSGNVTIYGGASDNVSVSRVCIQIDADNDGDFDEADFTKLKSDLSIETPVSYNAASFNTGDLVASSAQDKNDWYIVAEGTNSWKYTYNSSLLTVRDSKQNLRVRVRAIDNDGQTRVYSEANDILIDSTVPWFTNVKLCRYGSSFQGASDPDADTPVVAEREYVSGMYISDVGSGSNGIWYLVANVNSNSTISNVSSVSIPSTTSIVIDLAKDGTETFVAGETLKHARKTSENEYTLTIPLDTTQSGVIQAEISAENTVGNGSQQIKINIDSTPPALYNKNGSETYSAISEGAGDNKDLRVKSQYKTIGKNGTSSSAEYATIENSDGFFTFGDSVKESGSGLQYLAFYFKNTVSNTVYDPMNSKTGNVVEADSKTNGKLYINEDNLAAFYIKNATRNAESTFEYSDLDTRFVRKGGLVKIGGTYHLISEVNNATKTVSFAPGVSKAFKEVEIIYAQIVDHMLTESFEDEYDEDDNKTVVIMNDDGDGMCETINQIGSVYQWTASINSNNIPDGTTEICVAAIDNAGNISSGKVESMVANNRPRITKVFIGTDLNGNKSYDFDADEAPVVSTSKKLRTADGTSFGEFNYYGAYDTRSGFGRSTVTIASNKFKVTNGLCVIPEFTGGNGSLKYVLTDGENSEPQTAPSPVAMTTRDSLTTGPSPKIKTVTGGISMFGNTAIGENGNENPVAYGITDNSDPGNPVTYGDFGGIVIDNVTGNDGEVKTLSFTFWDETDGKQNACQSQWAILNVPVTIKSGDSVPPVPRIKPFHWLSATDNSILIEEKIAKGHIELEDDLAGGKWSEIQTVFGDTEDQKKPKVSGKIKLEGTVYDDVRLSSIKLAVFGGASTVVSNYTNGAWVPASLPTGVVSFTAEDLDMSQNGHTVKYTAVIDTEKTSVGIGKTIVVNADDWNGNTVAASGSSQTKRSYALWSARKSETDAMKTYFTDPACTVAVTEKTNDSDIVYKNEFTDCYIMDVVPYVTEVVTQLSPFYRQAPSVYARTALGSYPVKEGSSVEFKGFNLGTNEAQVTIRGMAKTSLSGGNKITIEGTSSGKTGATSGAVSVYVNDIPAINNLNNNNAQGNANKILTSSNYEDYAYNRQPNGINNNVLTDDLELDVWQFKEAARAKNGSILQPHMKVGPTGQLGFSYANATLYFNMPGKASDGTEYGQTPFGRNFGGFTQNAFTYDSSGTAYGVALCPDTSGQAGMSANLQFFSGKSGLDGNEGGGDLNNNYYNQDYARRIENTSLKLDGSSITQNINRIQSPSMTTYTKDSNKYVYVAYYDELSRQVRFRVGSIGSSSNVIGMGLVDLAGAKGRVSGKDDEPKLNRNTTRDSISGYRTEEPAVKTINVTSVTNDIYVLVPQSYGYKYIHAWEGYSTGVAYPGVQMPLVNDYYIYKMPDTSSTKLILNNGVAGDSNKAGSGDLKISSSGVYSWNGSSLEKLTSGTIKYQSSSSTMPTYEGYQYCHVVAASGVSNGTAQYNSATSKKAGQYVSVGALSDGTAVMAWYDSGAGRLAFSYNSEPLTAKTTLQAGTETWQNNSYYVSDSSIRAGTHVSMAVDASDGIHLAYYSASGGDLYYSYIKNPKTQSKPTKTVMVDSYGSVGTYTMIDVARDSETSQFIPYISFRCESNADTTASVKIAYPVQWSEGNVLSGVDEYDRYTGNWEVSVIPTDNTPLTDYTNIGLNKNWSTGVRSAFSTGSDVSKSWSATFAVGDSTTVYGNGTNNPILSYAVSENGVLEMAQKK